MATIGILQERAIRRRDILAEQLQAALNSRVLIEQAKGILAERGQLDLFQAFTLLRDQARSNNVRLSDLAREVITGAATSDALLRPSPADGPWWRRCIDHAGQADADRRSERADTQRTPATQAV